MNGADTTTQKLSKKPGGGPRKKLNLDEVLTRVVELFVRHNPRELTYSTVSRLVKVPRSTLYYYFGKEFSNLVKEATNFGMTAFIRLIDLEKEARSGEIKPKNWNDFQQRRFREVLQIVARYPWAPTLYFRYRNDGGQMGEIVRDLEKRYLSGLAAAWKKMKGKNADPQAVRISSYIKIGLLFGISVESDYWDLKKNVTKLDELSLRATALTTQVLESFDKF